MNSMPGRGLSSAGEENDIQLSDIFDPGELQRLQDLFSEATGLASLITDTNGKPITRPANFCRLCSDIIRKTDKGLANCYSTHASVSSSDREGTAVQSCFGGGLWYAGTSITLGGRRLANWLIGQVRFDENDEQRMAEYALEIGANADDFRMALAEVPVMPKSQLEKAARMLFAYATDLSEKAYTNLQLKNRLAERERADALLLESEARFKNMFERHASVMLLIEPDSGRIVDANAAAVQFYGYGRSELLSMNISELNSLNPEQIAAELRNANEEKRNYFVFPHKRAQGDVRMVEVHSTPVDMGGSRLLFSIIHDVSERLEAEEALRASTDFANSLITSMHDGVSVLDKNGIHIDVNPALCSMTGFTRAELMGTGIPQPYWPPEEYETIQKAFQKTIAEEGGNFELTFMRKNGQRFPVIISPFAIRDKSGHIVSYSATIKDITGRKKAEDELVQSKIQLQLAHRSAGAGTWDWDMTTQKLDWSNELYALFGLDPDRDEATFDSWTQAVHPDDRALAAGLIEQAVRDQTPLNSEYRVVHPGGQVHWISSLGDTTYGHEGLPLRMTGICTDITARRHAEEELSKSEEQYRLLFENSIDGVALHQIIQDDSGKPVDYIFLQANETFGKQTGLKIKDIAGKRVTEILPGTERTPLIEVYGKVALSGRPVSFEQYFEPLKRHFHINAYQVGQGRFVTVFQDITERRMTELALQQSEVRYRNLLSGLEAGIVVHAPDTSIIMSNQKASELLGLNEDQLRGRLAVDPNWKFLDENKDPLPFSEYPVNQIVASQKPFHDKIMGIIRPSANDLVWLTVNGFPVFGQQGELSEILISFIDITQRKQAEDALRLKNLVFDASLAANSISDTEGILTEVNATFIRIWGYLSREDVIGRPISDFIMDAKDALTIIETLNSQEGWEGDYVARKKDGSTFMAHGLATTIRDAAGKLTGYQSAVIDITLRKQAEEVLKESERAQSQLLARLNEAQHIALIGSWEWDLLSNQVWWSDETYRIFGVGRDFVPGFEANGKLIHPDDLDLYGKSFEHSLHTGEPLNIDIRIITGKNELKYCRAEGQVFTDESESLVRFTGTIMDVSLQKMKENEIRESEKKFRETVAYLDEGYYSVTPEGTLLDHNQAFCRMLDFDSADDLRGSHLPDFWQNPEDRTRYLQAFTATGIISNYEIAAKTKLGGKITVLASAHLVNDEKGKPLRIEGIFLDITGRIRNEESLQKLALRLQNLNQIDKAILNAIESPEAIVQSALGLIRSQLECQRASVGIFDQHQKEVQIFAADIGGLTIVQACEVLTEEIYGNIDILRQNKMEIIEDMARVSSPSAIARVLMAEGIASSINVALFSSKGLYGALNLCWEKARAFKAEELEIIEEVAGQISIAMEQARLLNEVKGYAAELEKRVHERTAQLEISNKELEAFSYSVSHDLRAPLRHISGFVDLLTKSFHGRLPEKEQHYLDTISDSTRQMGVLIDDLLEFSRTGRQEMQLSALNMNLVLREALKAINQDSNSQDVIWEIGQLPQVYGDYSLLRLVWLNLLSNAVKFRRAGVPPCIHIGCMEVGSEYVFSVRDNGVGFDMQYAQKLFGVFQRMHSPQEFEGTGIGLANVRRIILRHGGRTWAEAGLDTGAVFYFSLPNINKKIKP